MQVESPGELSFTECGSSSCLQLLLNEFADVKIVSLSELFRMTRTAERELSVKHNQRFMAR